MQFSLIYIPNIYSLHYYKVEYTKPKSLGLWKSFNFIFKLLGLAMSMSLVSKYVTTLSASSVKICEEPPS
jgi:hypothetical protein